MRIGVFFQEFEPYHYAKDPGQIVLGLSEIGVEVELVTLGKPILSGYKELPIRLIQSEQARDAAFWRSSRYDMVLAYTWLRSSFLWIPQLLNAAGLPVIVKGDTDGRLTYPLYPMWDTYLGSLRGILPSLRITRRRLKQRLGARQRIGELSTHLDLASGAVVETPQAFCNVAYILTAHGVPHLVEKIAVIPNPVAPSNLPPVSKLKNVVAIGDWERKFGDYYQKNTKSMCIAIARFLSARPDYRAALIGKGDTLLRNLLSRVQPAVSSRISVMCDVPHSNVLNTLQQSQILFMPSIMEGLSIAASEALVSGCSIVGSPLESLAYLSQGGKYGTLAANFDEDAYFGALVADAVRWDRSDYSPVDTANYWNNELNRKKIAEDYHRLFIKVLKLTKATITDKIYCPNV